MFWATVVLWLAGVVGYFATEQIIWKALALSGAFSFLVTVPIYHYAHEIWGRRVAVFLPWVMLFIAITVLHR